MKFTISEDEINFLVKSLPVCDEANTLLERLCDLDPANDGPECAILSVERQ